MITAKVFPKGQITIPKRIREKLGIKEGDILSLEERGDIVVLKKGRTLFDVAGSIELEKEVALKALIEEAREGPGSEDLKDRR